jgi:hypothetical protein
MMKRGRESVRSSKPERREEEEENIEQVESQADEVDGGLETSQGNTIFFFKSVLTGGTWSSG